MRFWPILILFLTPLANAAYTQPTFPVGSWTADGATIPGLTTQYFPMFGDTAPRNTESDVVVQATLNFNATNLRVSSNIAACGGLTAGETFTFALRKNGVDTSLLVVCTSGTALNEALTDSDVVPVSIGDRLTYRVTSAGTILGVPLRVGVTLQGSDQVIVQGEDQMQFMDLTTQESWTLLFWLGIMFYSMRRGWPWIAGVCLLAVPMVFVTAFATTDKFVWGVILLIIAMWIQYLVSGGKLEDVSWGSEGRKTQD